MPAREGEILVALPIGGRLDILGLHPRPAVAEPERGGVVAAIGDEFLPFAVADRAAGERVRRQQPLMEWAFEVEGEIFARMARRRDASGAFDPFHRARQGVVEGKSVSVRVKPGGGGTIQ